MSIPSLRQKQINEVLDYYRLIDRSVFDRNVKSVFASNQSKAEPHRTDIETEANLRERVDRMKTTLQQLIQFTAYIDTSPAEGKEGTMEGRTLDMSGTKLKSKIDSTLASILSDYNGICQFYDTKNRAKVFSESEGNALIGIIRELHDPIVEAIGKIMLHKDTNKNYFQSYRVLKTVMENIDSAPPLIKIPTSLLTEPYFIPNPTKYKPIDEPLMRHIADAASEVEKLISAYEKIVVTSATEKAAKNKIISKLQAVLGRIEQLGKTHTEHELKMKAAAAIAASKAATTVIASTGLPTGPIVAVTATLSTIVPTPSGVSVGVVDKSSPEFATSTVVPGLPPGPAPGEEEVEDYPADFIESSSDEERVSTPPVEAFETMGVTIDIGDEGETIYIPYKFVSQDEIESITKKAHTEPNYEKYELRKIKKKNVDRIEAEIAKLEDKNIEAREAIRVAQAELDTLDPSQNVRKKQLYEHIMNNHVYTVRREGIIANMIKTIEEKTGKVAPAPSTSVVDPIVQAALKELDDKRTQLMIELGDVNQETDMDRWEALDKEISALEKQIEEMKGEGKPRRRGGNNHYGDDSVLAPYLSKHLKPSKFHVKPPLQESSSESDSDMEPDHVTSSEESEVEEGGRKSRRKKKAVNPNTFAKQGKEGLALLEKIMSKPRGGRKKSSKPLVNNNRDKDMWFM